MPEKIHAHRSSEKLSYISMQGEGNIENGISLNVGLTNQHLLPCNGGYLLVEGGSKKKFPQFLRELESRGIDPGEIRYLFITHHHEDHAGFAALLREVSDCRIIVHKEAVQPLEQGKCELTSGGIVNWRVVFSGFGFYALAKGVRMLFPPIELGEADFIVENDDDELLRSLGVPGKILCTPGHSPDSISLLLDDGSCFCGDAAFNLMPWLGTRYLLPLISDMESSYRSWRKMIREGASIIYPSHGNPFPKEKLEQNIDHFKQEDLVLAGVLPKLVDLFF